MSADIELNWEWPAERPSEQKVLVQVNNIKEQGGGFFGVLKSPSLANSLPDAQVLSGKVINTDKSLDGKSITLIVPKLEIESIKSGDYVVMGIVQEKICICITPVNSKDIDISSIACP